MTALLAVLLILGAAASLGALGLRTVGLDPRSAATQVAWTFAMGYALLTVIAAALLGAHIFRPLPVATVLGVAAAIGATSLRKLATRPRVRSRPSGSKAQAVIVAVLLAVIAANVVTALAPQSSGDTLAYHYALPLQLIREGGKGRVTQDVMQGPIAVHALHALAFVLGGERAANLQSLMFGILALVAVVAAADRRFGPLPALVAGLGVYSSPAVASISGTGSVELAMTLCLVVAFDATLVVVHRGSVRHAFLAGAALGLGSGAKLFGVFGLLACGAVLAFAVARARPRERQLVLWAMASLGLSAVVVASPWYVRTYLATGNPVFPAMQSVFGGRGLSPARADLLQDLLRWEKRPFGSSAWGWLTALPRLAVGDGDAAALRVGVGPLFAGLAPVAAFGLRRFLTLRRILTSTTIFFAAFYTLWFFIALQRDRHLLPAMAALAPMLSGGCFAAVAPRGRRWLRLPLLAVAAAVIVAGAGAAILQAASVSRVVVGLESRDRYLAHAVPTYVDARRVARSLGPDSYLLHFHRSLSYLISSPNLYASPLQGEVDWTAVRSADQLARRVRRLGVTHVLMYDYPDGLPEPRSPMADEIDRIRALIHQYLHAHARRIYEETRLMQSSRTARLGAVRMRASFWVAETPAAAAPGGP